MPNWTQNRVCFVSKNKDAKQINELKEKLKSKESVFDFNKIVPMPKDIFRGNLGDEERKKYGKRNWYDWSSKYWGTKWNSCEARIVEENNESIEYRFETAWDCPRAIAKKITKILPQGVFVSYWESKHEDDPWDIEVII